MFEKYCLKVARPNPMPQGLSAAPVSRLLNTQEFQVHQLEHASGSKEFRIKKYSSCNFLERIEVRNNQLAIGFRSFSRLGIERCTNNSAPPSSGEFQLLRSSFFFF